MENKKEFKNNKPVKMQRLSMSKDGQYVFIDFVERVIVHKNYLEKVLANKPTSQEVSQ